MRRTLFLKCLLCLLVWDVIAASPCAAQLFGPRTIRRNKSSRGVSSADPGTPPAGNRRFIRGARDASNFVGADRQEAVNFVGSTQASNDGSATTSVEGLREQSVVRVNRARQLSATGIYAERLTIGFTVPRRPPVNPRANQNNRPSVLLTPEANERASVARLNSRPAEIAPQPRRAANAARESSARGGNQTTDSKTNSNQPPRSRFATLNKIASQRGFSVRVSDSGEAATLTGTVASKHDREVAGILAMFEPGLQSVKNELKVDGESK